MSLLECLGWVIALIFVLATPVALLYGAHLTEVHGVEVALVLALYVWSLGVSVLTIIAVVRLLWWLFT